MNKYTIFMLAMLLLSACKNDTNIQNASVNNIQKTELPYPKNIPQNTYNWDKHNDPRIFFADFQNAIKNRDQEAVYNMCSPDFFCITSFCLNKQNGNEDAYIKSYPQYKNTPDLSFESKADFYKKYDFLFPKEYEQIILEMKDIQTKEEILEEKIKLLADESEISAIKHGMVDYSFQIPLKRSEVFFINLNKQGIYKIAFIGSQD